MVISYGRLKTSLHDPGRGAVAGAKRGRAEALHPQGRCAAGRVAHTELAQ